MTAISTAGADKPTIPADAPAPGANAYAHSYYRTHYLEAWQTQIDALETALRDADKGRAYLGWIADRVIVLEATMLLSAAGSNAEQRRASLTLALRDDEDYQASLADQRKTEAQIRDADNRASIARNRIRLHEAIVEGWPK